MVHEQFRRQWRRFKDYLLHRILHVDDTPHRIALGAAVGIFIAWTPTFGLQTLIAIALAAIVRANKAAVIPMVWITNPITNPALYGFSYFVGHLLLTGSMKVDPAIRRQLMQLMKETMRLDIWHASFWSRLIEVSLRIGVELWVGSLVLGVAAAVPTYFLVKRAVIRYRRHKDLKKKLFPGDLADEQQDAA